MRAGSADPLETTPLAPDAPLPGLSSTWTLDQSTLEVRRLARQLHQPTVIPHALKYHRARMLLTRHVLRNVYVAIALHHGVGTPPSSMALPERTSHPNPARHAKLLRTNPTTHHQVVAASRRLLALQQMLGGGVDTTQRRGGLGGGGSGGAAVDVVWMVVREPQLLSVDLGQLTGRLLDMKVWVGAGQRGGRGAAGGG